MKILLIEDDAALVSALKIGLEKDGFVVDAISDGEEGKKRFEVHSDAYDLAILDLGLPNVSGDLICSHVRSKGIKTPILILTGKSKTEDKVEVLNSGADDYLTKPFSLDELKARVRALLRRPKPLLQTELVHGDIVLNPTTRKVSMGGTEIALTLKEFGMLEYMMRNPNQVVLRDDILDHVWDFNFSSLSNIVDVHINKLRKKLGSKSNILETVRGVGYRLKA